MPKVSAAHREARRSQIVEAALQCFIHKGFQRTSMADIIEASGLSAGAIYLHFASKQEIASAAAQSVVGRRVGDIRDRLTQSPLPDPGQFVQLVMTGLATEVHDSRLLVQLWAESFFDPAMSQLVDGVFQRLRAVLVDYLAGWSAAERGLDADAARAWGERAAPAMLSLLQGHILQSAILPSFDTDAYADAVRAVLP